MNGEGPTYSTGASKFAHHFGRARAGTLAEQLILHDWVSQGSKPLPLTVASGAAAALAAGEDNEGGLGTEELIGGGTVCGVIGSATGRSFRGKRSPVVQPASAKIRKAAISLMHRRVSASTIPWIVVRTLLRFGVSMGAS